MSPYENLMRDLADELRRDATASRAEARERPKDAFAQGAAYAYHCVLSLLQQQAAAFGVPLADIALEGFDADRDLL